jgi:hypothetical protein
MKDVRYLGHQCASCAAVRIGRIGPVPAASTAPAGCTGCIGCIGCIVKKNYLEFLYSIQLIINDSNIH